MCPTLRLGAGALLVERETLPRELRLVPGVLIRGELPMPREPPKIPPLDRLPDRDEPPKIPPPLLLPG